MAIFSKIELNKIAEKYKLSDIYLFGSRVSGFQREGSDLDIGVRFENGLPEEKTRGKIYRNLFSDLGLCFKEQKIDLVFISEVPLHFQYKIITEGKLIYAKNSEKSLDFQEKIINDYLDYKYFIDDFFQGILEVSVSLKI